MSDDNPSDYLPLAAEFPAASYEQWRKLAQAAIEGARYEEQLQSHTADGLTIEPLYRRAQPPSLVTGRARGARWQVLQRIDHPDPAAARAQAIEDLNGGANGLVMVGASAIGAHGYGLPPDANAINSLLDAIDLENGVAIEFDAGPQSNTLALSLSPLIARRCSAPERMNIRFGIDPIGNAALAGELLIGRVGAGFKPAPKGAPRNPRELLNEFISGHAHELAEAGFRRSLLAADGRIIHDAGGTEAQELAYVLASGIAMLRALEAGGIALDDARRMIFFRLTADTDQFVTIAKFRALRRLWQRVEASCGLAPEPVFITAETAWRIMTRYDPTVNIVRATIAAFAAGIGGADAVAVLPFTAARGLPDAFARRIARNTQLVLLDEANLARVADPTAGTGWSEDLTLKLCRVAWVLLQEIEGSGGPVAALQNGLIQAKVAAVRAERERAVATQRCALVGVNEFPDLTETPVDVLSATPAKLPSAANPALGVEPLSPIRLAEPFESLREASEHLAASGRRPKILLANLGEPSDYAPRADLARNFFAAGGIDAATIDSAVINNDGSVDKLVRAFSASGSKLACLCATDEVYGLTGQKIAEALSAAGALRLYAVGRPAGLEQLRTGVLSFISGDCDMLEILRDAHRLLGLLS
jgi:methylmalonyl-CoA mutase